MGNAPAQDERAQQVAQAFPQLPAEQRRGTQRLVVERLHARGRAVRARVALYDGDQRVPIDPDRIVVNPPTQVAEGQRGERRRHDSAGALWAALWDSVTRHPGRRPGTTGGG